MTASTKTVKHEARPKVGSVVVTVVGSARAKIFIDKELVAEGLTITQSLTPGRHVIRAKSKNHRPAVETVQVVAGRTHAVRLTLEKKPRSVNSVKDPFEDE